MDVYDESSADFISLGYTELCSIAIKSKIQFVIISSTIKWLHPATNSLADNNVTPTINTLWQTFHIDSIEL